MRICVHIKNDIFVRAFLLCNILLISITGINAQEKSDITYWTDHELAIADFKPKSKNEKQIFQVCHAEFSWEYGVTEVDINAKNFNNKVRHGISMSQSWIDQKTDNYEKELSLRYMQTLFNINEIYARQFRKQLSSIGNSLTKNIQLVNELNATITTSLKQRKRQYSYETSSGNDELAQKRWEKQIKKELSALSKYAFDK